MYTADRYIIILLYTYLIRYVVILKTREQRNVILDLDLMIFGCALVKVNKTKIERAVVLYYHENTINLYNI